MGLRPTLTVVLLLPGLAACDLITGSGEALVVSTADTASVPSASRAAYLDDAARLALRYARQAGDPAQDSVEIPADLVRTLYRALVFVYNATRLPARDMVVAYDIHTWPQPEVRGVTVVLDPNRPWVQVLLRGERRSGNPDIDRLMETYALELASGVEGSPSIGWWIVLRSRRPLNAAALSRRFAGIDGVAFAYTPGTIGSGNDITATREREAWQLEYSVGFGDCPAGCIGRHFWTFLVYADGRVVSLRDRGDPLPPPGRRP